MARRRPEVFQKYIRCGQQLVENLPGLFVAQVERHAFLISIERAEAWAVAFVFGIAPAMGIAAIGQLDLDHFAAQIAEQTTRVGPGHMAADVDTSIAFEGAGDHSCFKTSPMSLIAIKNGFPPRGDLA